MNGVTLSIRRTVIVAASIVGLAGAAPGHDALRHVKLVRSEPVANDTVSSPKALRLWFSEKIERKLSSVKLADATGASVTLLPATRDESQETAPLVSAPSKALPPGAYTISWSAAAADGHPSKGTIEFVVKAGK